MSDTPESRADLTRLLSGLSDGTLEAADEERLAEVLHTDPAARAKYFDHVMLAALLRREGRRAAAQNQRNGDGSRYAPPDEAESLMPTDAARRLPRPAERVLLTSFSASRVRPWLLVLAASVLLGLLLSVGEATGVTRLVPTMIRIVTGEGSLVIEVDDPSISVMLDGTDVTITGAGIHELRLRPGTHKFVATKDGRPFSEESVTIERNGKQVVKVNREESPASKPLSQEQKLEQARQQMEEADRLYKLGEPLRGPDPWQSELHFRKAVAIYEKLAQEFQESPASKRKLAACRWGLGSALNAQVSGIVLKSPPATLEESQRAVALAKEAVGLAPTETGFWITLGLAQGRVGDWNASREALEKAEQVPARDVPVFNEIRTQFALAMTYWHLGDKVKARERYQRAAELVEKHPANFELRTWQAEAGKLLGIESQPKKPVAADQKSTNPSGETPLTSKPQSQAQKLEQSRQQLEEADRLYKLGDPLRGPDPWQAELHFRKAVAIYQKLGQDFPESSASKQKLAACRWGLASALNMQVHLLVYKGAEISPEETARAIAAGQEATELAPSDAGFWTNLGMAHYREKDWNSALAALEKGPAIQDYNSSRTRFCLALVHWQLGNKDQARRFYDQAVQWMDQNKPNDPWLQRLRAEAKALLEQQ